MDKVMLIDDDLDLHKVLADLLVGSGYQFVGVSDPLLALDAVAREKPDLLLLDVMMPRVNGFKICQEVRAQGRRIPIVFLTAKSDIVDKSIGFQAGAADYVTKPFDTEELLLRIEAHLRRHRDVLSFAHALNRDGSATIGDLEVRFDEYRALLRGEQVPLTTKEFEIVAFLAANPGKVFTREQIYEHIYGAGDEGRSSSNVTVFVRKIREKIEENPSEPKYLLTVPRVGYKMTSEL